MSRRAFALSCVLILLLMLLGSPVAVAGPAGGSSVASQAPSSAGYPELAAKKAARDLERANEIPGTDTNQGSPLPLSPLAADVASLAPDDGSGMRTTGAGLVPVYRLTDKYTGSIFLTNDVVEAAAYLAVLGEYYQYDGCAFLYDPTTDSGTPLYRFYNEQTDGYFYTASVAERDRVIASYPGLWTYEGICGYISNNPAGRTPVYRFYGRDFGDQCYVADTGDRDALLASMSYRWMYEGVAFYAYPPASSSGTGSITGTVTDPWGAPLKGFRVRVIAEFDDGTWTATTDASGAYTVTGLPAGTYYVTFSSWPRFYYDGWVGMPEYFNNQHVYDGDLLSPVNVVADTATSGINARLEHLPMPVYRFYNPGAGTHFYTPDPAEAVNVMENLSDVFSYEGICYYMNPVNNTQSLYRFYNYRNGSHFYTADPNERDTIIATLGGTYQYDGPTYSVNRSPVANSVPVYRFFRPRAGCHFFTADEAERATVQATLGGTYLFEGPVYWLGQ